MLICAHVWKCLCCLNYCSNLLFLNVIFVYYLLACTVAPHSCGGVWCFGLLLAIVLLPIMYALAQWLHCSTHCFSIHFQHFNMGCNGKLAHSLHGIFLTALQLACLLSSTYVGVFFWLS